MKKILTWGISFFVIGVGTYLFANRDKINDIIRINDLPPVLFDSLGTPYVRGQYVITFPPNIRDTAIFADSLRRKGLKFVYACPCSWRLQLWEIANVLVSINPDDAIPPMRPTGGSMIIFNPQPPFAGFSNFNIVKNFLPSSIPNKPPNPLSLPSDFRLPPLLLPVREEVKVAIIDTGVDPSVGGGSLSNYLFRNNSNTPYCNSPFMEGIYGVNMLNRNRGQNMEPSDRDTIPNIRPIGHGSLINCIAAGLAKDQTNTSDLPNLKIINVKFIERREEQGTLFNGLCGIHYALNKGATIINTSWEIKPHYNTDAERAQFETSVRNSFYYTLSEIKNANALLITSTGKKSTNTNGHIWPAQFVLEDEFRDNIITVGAWEQKWIWHSGFYKVVANYSNENDFVNVYAPGRATIDCNYFDKGVSYATPHITFEAAKLKGQLGANSSAAEIKRRILVSSPLVNNKRMFAPNSSQ